MKLPSTCMVVAAIVLLLVLMVFIVFGDNGLMALTRLHGREHAMVDQNETLARENVGLYRIIGRLKRDPRYIESVARHELGMVGKDDIIIIRQANRKTGK